MLKIFLLLPLASEVLKNNTLRIYPSDETEIDHLVTKALVLGDFESAVSLCISMYIVRKIRRCNIISVKGGSELFWRTQQAYFQKRTVTLPCLRLYQSIVTDDFKDIEQTTDLQEWQEILVVLCTFAKVEDFPRLAEQLGQSLEFRGTIARSSDAAIANECRKNATLTSCSWSS